MKEGDKRAGTLDKGLLAMPLGGGHVFHFALFFRQSFENGS